MSDDIERKFNRMMRDQAFHEFHEGRPPIDWGIAFVWILIMMIGVSTLITVSLTAYALVTLTWGEIADLFSGGGS